MKEVKINLEISQEIREKIKEYSNEAVISAKHSKECLDDHDYYESVCESSSAIFNALRVVANIFGEDGDNAIELSGKIYRLVNDKKIDIYFQNVLDFSIGTCSEAACFPENQVTVEDAEIMLVKATRLLEELEAILFN